MKRFIILAVSFLIALPLLASEWKAKITEVDKRGKTVIVRYRIYLDNHFLSTSSVQLPFDKARSVDVLTSIDEQLHQIAFNANKIIEPPDFPNKFTSIENLKGQTITVDSEVLDTQKIPSERNRLADEARKAEQQAEWEANAPERLKKAQDKVSGIAKLKELGLTKEQADALFGD